MRYNNVTLAAVECVLPPNVVTSEQIEHRLKPLYDRLRLPYGRLELMSGIGERRFWNPGTRPSQAAAQAGEKALEVAGIDRERVGCLVHASVCRDFMEPATAALVHESLRLPESCAIFDLSNACLGVVSAMATVADMIELGRIEAGLVVSGEVAEGLHEATLREALASRTLTRTEFKRHFASLTIASGAAAVLLSREKAGRGLRLLGGAARTDSSANRLCREDTSRQSNAGPLMSTDSEALLHAGCALAKRTWLAAQAELGWDNAAVDRAFTHQVGNVHRKLLFETLELDLDKDFPTVAFTGNTGSAALPTAFALGLERRPPRPGEKAALLGIGSGLSSMILGVEC